MTTTPIHRAAVEWAVGPVWPSFDPDAVDPSFDRTLPTFRPLRRRVVLPSDPPATGRGLHEPSSSE